MRRRAATLLLECPTEQARAALIRAALRDPSYLVRDAASEALLSIGLGQSIEIIVDALDDSSLLRNRDAFKLLDLLNAFGDANIVESLIRHLQGSYSLSKDYIADALAKSGAPQALAALANKLKDEDRNWRDTALSALVMTNWLPRAEDVPDLVGLLVCGTGLVLASPSKVREAICRIGADATEHLVLLTRRDYAKLKDIAFELLAEVGDARAVPTFMALCRSEDIVKIEQGVRGLELILQRAAAYVHENELRAIMAMPDTFTGCDVGREADRYDTPVYYPWSISCCAVKAIASNELSRRGGQS